MHLSALRGPPAAPCAPRSSRRALAPAPVRYRPGPAPREPHQREEEDDEARPSPSSSSSQALDVLRSAIPLSTFDRAEQALAEFCSTKPSAEAKEQCLQVLRYYREKRAVAQRSCILEIEQHSSATAASTAPQRSLSPAAATASPACATLAQLERLMHETSYSGDAAHLYQVLAAQRAMEARRQQYQEGDDNGAPCSSSPAADAARGTAAAADALRLRALRLFHLADADADGRLDREEFLAAIALMDAELADAELGAVFSALDARCSLTAEQFVDAVTGESLLAAALAQASVDDDAAVDADAEGEGEDGRAGSRGGRAFLRRHVRRHQAAPGADEAQGGGAGAAQAGAGCDADALRRVRHSRPTWWSDAPGYLEMV